MKLSTKGGLSPDPTIMDTPGPAGIDACEFKFGITNHLFKNKIQPQLFKGTDKLLIYCIFIYHTTKLIKCRDVGMDVEYIFQFFSSKFLQAFNVI